MLGQRNVVQTTPGTDGNLGYNFIAKDDDVWVYTGVTSATADNSIVGFVLISQRTAESHFYSVSGATGLGDAVGRGPGAEPALPRHVPLLINVSGQPTYFMALKDDAGLVKQFAMLDINATRTWPWATRWPVPESLPGAAGPRTASAAPIRNVGTGSPEAQGTISHIPAQAVVEGSNSHFYVTLEGDKGIYDFAFAPASSRSSGTGRRRHRVQVRGSRADEPRRDHRQHGDEHRREGGRGNHEAGRGIRPTPNGVRKRSNIRFGREYNKLSKLFSSFRCPRQLAPQV